MRERGFQLVKPQQVKYHQVPPPKALHSLILQMEHITPNFPTHLKNNLLKLFILRHQYHISWRLHIPLSFLLSPRLPIPLRLNTNTKMLSSVLERLLLHMMLPLPTHHLRCVKMHYKIVKRSCPAFHSS